MPLNMKNINNFTQWKKNGSVDVTFARATMHQKHLAQSGRSLGAVRGVQWTFSIHSAYLLKSQSENKKFSCSVWIAIINNNNNFAPSLFRSLCEFVSDSFGPRYFSSLRKIPWSKTITSNFTQWPQKRWCTVIIV